MSYFWLFVFYLDYLRKEKPSLIFEILKRLSELRRFDMAVMFMSEPEKKSKFSEESFCISVYSCVFLYMVNKMIVSIYWMFVMYRYIQLNLS